jgi:hypothetical protein
LFPRTRDCQIHHATAGAGAVKFGEEVDAAQFKVSPVRQSGWKIGRGEHRIADGCGAGLNLGEPSARLRLLKSGLIGGGKMVLPAMGQERVAGDESGKRLEQGGGADERQSGRIRFSAFTDCRDHFFRINRRHQNSGLVSGMTRALA